MYYISNKLRGQQLNFKRFKEILKIQVIKRDFKQFNKIGSKCKTI